MEIHNCLLNNGIRLVHVQIPSPVAHFAWMVNTGSRDELSGEHGMAHLIEHLLFKGTKSRKAFQITNRLENLGGDLNAYTTKEETCVHATFLLEDYTRALELVADIVFDSVFAEREMTKEKEVILDEINSTFDNPSELIFDEFDGQIFHAHPIGKTILGTPRSLEKLTRAQVMQFIERQYHTPHMVISSVANLPFDKVKRLADKYFGYRTTTGSPPKRIPVSACEPVHKTNKRKTHQAHVVMGNLAYPMVHPRRISLLLLANLLGGSSLNSRLNLSLREKHGLVYGAEASYTAFSDTGIFSIYYSTEKKHLDKTISLVNKELERIRQEKLGQKQLQKAQKQLLGQIAILRENHEGMMLNMAKNFLHRGTYNSLAELTDLIYSTSPDEILEIANEVLNQERLSSLIYC